MTMTLTTRYAIIDTSAYHTEIMKLEALHPEACDFKILEFTDETKEFVKVSYQRYATKEEWERLYPPVIEKN